jgi:signal transduction histidine kinase/ActR/RegA family two-component response regulator
VTDATSVNLEERLLILAPVGKDGPLTCEKLAAAGLHCLVCSSLATLVNEIERGAAGLLITEEALAGGTGRLVETLASQPSWSDLPILIITRQGADSGTVALALHTLGNVTLLERPVRVSTLVSSARTALRARLRQYESRAQLRSLEEADRRKDEFLATLAHELRNPLAPIRNSVELLRISRAGLPMVQRVAEIMGRQVAHMVRLVDDLLEISRITRGTIELRRSRVELASVVASAVETSRPAVDAADHHLEVILPPEPIWLDADPTRLAQVFSNLLNNAAKYTDNGGRIRLSAERRGNDVVVEVQDSGIGIDGPLLPRIFDMFTQGEPAATRAPSGLGIGLTLVRSLVEMHHGSVKAHSDGIGRGSLLTVRLPIADPAIDHAAPDTPTAAADAETVPRVLVVDDNRDAAESLGDLLGVLGADVVVAHDGEGALELLEMQPADIVFLDIGMPQMDGYEVARRIRRIPQAQGVLLVALTGWGQEKDRLRSEDAGFDRHLVKPADLDALEAILRSAVPVTAPRSDPD